MRCKASLATTMLVASLGLIPALQVNAQPVDTQQTTPVASSALRAANLIYADNRTSDCYAQRFLTDVANATHLAIDADFAFVRLDGQELFDHPFAVWSGEGSFELTSVERDALQDYLRFGGFVVASAGCSDSRWSRSFRAEIARLFPQASLTPLDPAHPAYHNLYPVTDEADFDELPRLLALQLDGRIVLVFSPDGLNDTDEAGGDCCCCGGREVETARQINANLLMYALTR